MTDQTKKAAIGGGVTVAIVAAVAAGVALQPGADDQDAAVTPTPTARATESGSDAVTPTATASGETVPSPSQTVTASPYADGTYTATGAYTSPGGREEIDVKLTLAAGLVAEATVTSKAENPTSRNYQSQFISGYKAQVIGKPIDSLRLGRVSGSSLTPGGFNSAVDQIKQQAS